MTSVPLNPQNEQQLLTPAIAHTTGQQIVGFFVLMSTGKGGASAVLKRPGTPSGDSRLKSLG